MDSCQVTGSIYEFATCNIFTMRLTSLALRSLFLIVANVNMPPPPNLHTHGALVQPGFDSSLMVYGSGLALTPTLTLCNCKVTMQGEKEWGQSHIT